MAPFLEHLPFVWAAHRGASADRPENTFAAFEEAIRQGADLIELDVRLSRDGEVVVLHDATLERTTSGAGHVWERSAAELAELDAGSWFDPRFRGERVPRLRDVLERIAPRVPINVELKGRPAGGLERAVAELVRASGASERVLISSFRIEALAEVRRHDGALPIGLLYEDAAVSSLESDAKRVAASFLHPAAGLVSSELLARAGALGLRTIVWTVDDPPIARALRDEGVHGIITNRVAALKSVLGDL